MPEPDTIVKEPKPSEQEITDKYLEQREEGKTEDLPIPAPTIPEPEKPAEVVPEPVKAEEEPAKPPVLTEQQAVDAYLEVRKGEREKKRGGKQARIDELTKKAADLEREKEELAEKVKAAEIAKPVEPVKPIEAVKPAEPPKTRPKMNEFEDVDEYHAAMALWAVEERARTTAVAQPVTEKPAEVVQVRKEEFDKFLEEGKRFISGHPDFNTVLEAAHVRGLTLSEAARIEITRKAAPGVAYWLAKPENDLVARSLMKMDDAGQLVEIGRIMERLAVSPTDFISNAPEPGTRIANGNTRATIPVASMDTDDYIRMRKQERRARR